MKNKHYLLFGLIFFLCIFTGYLVNIFNFLLNTHFFSGNWVWVFNYFIKAALYIIEIIVIHVFYKKYIGNDIIDDDERQPLSIKKTCITYLITIALFTLISIMAGWQLKPLSDLGDNYNSLKIYERLAKLVKDAVEVIIIMKAFVCFDKFLSSNYKQYKYYTFSGLFILLTFGIYYLIIDFSIYQIVFLPFMLLLGFLYPYLNRSHLKTTLIALLIFLL